VNVSGSTDLDKAPSEIPKSNIAQPTKKLGAEKITFLQRNGINSAPSVFQKESAMKSPAIAKIDESPSENNEEQTKSSPPSSNEEAIKTFASEKSQNSCAAIGSEKARILKESAAKTPEHKHLNKNPIEKSIDEIRLTASSKKPEALQITSTPKSVSTSAETVIETSSVPKENPVKMSANIQGDRAPDGNYREIKESIPPIKNEAELKTLSSQRNASDCETTGTKKLTLQKESAAEIPIDVQADKVSANTQGDRAADENCKQTKESIHPLKNESELKTLTPQRNASDSESTGTKKLTLQKKSATETSVDVQADKVSANTQGDRAADGKYKQIKESIPPIKNETELKTLTPQRNASNCEVTGTKKLTLHKESATETSVDVQADKMIVENSTTKGQLSIMDEQEVPKTPSPQSNYDTVSEEGSLKQAMNLPAVKTSDDYVQKEKSLMDNTSMQTPPSKKPLAKKDSLSSLQKAALKSKSPTSESANQKNLAKELKSKATPKKLKAEVKSPKGKAGADAKQKTKKVSEKKPKIKTCSFPFPLEYDTEMMSYEEELADCQEALQNYKAIMRIRLLRLGRNHMKIASMYHNMGDCHYMMNDIISALSCYNKAHEARLKKLGENNVDVASTRNNMGVILMKQGKYDKSMECFKNILLVRQQKYGDNSVSYTDTLHNMGLVHNHKKEYQKAIARFQEALRVRRQLVRNKIKGASMQLVADSLYNLGITYAHTFHFKDALRNHREALELYRTVGFGDGHDSINNTTQWIDWSKKEIQHE